MAGNLFAIAERLEIDELAPPRDGEHRTGQLLARDLGIDRLADQREALAGDADACEGPARARNASRPSTSRPCRSCSVVPSRRSEPQIYVMISKLGRPEEIMRLGKLAILVLLLDAARHRRCRGRRSR